MIKNRAINSCKHSRVSANVKWFYCKNNGSDKTIIKEGGTFLQSKLYIVSDICVALTFQH